eukprot:TRINITY_DN82843_c0_g1_i1.p1 TRINITY_DN82843_c0_g1~~TRINITY_DN82843_c0_g1_i1.p1  ORF type:complete len:217 (-),score=23.34 TRINITY_DN82843_c0_g1_i1:264-866(-)
MVAVSQNLSSLNQHRVAGCCIRRINNLGRLQPSFRTCKTSRGLCIQVEAAKGKGSKMKTGQPPAPPVPDIDEENEEFVIFVKPVKLPTWLPYSLIKGTPAANQLVRSMTTKWGKVLFSNTMIRNIGESVYKEEEKVIQQLKAQYKEFSKFTEFQFGFKIRDKTKPKEWYLPEGIIVIPPKDKLGKAPLQALVERFTGPMA